MATARADARQQSDLLVERPPLPRSDRRPPPPLPPLPELPGRGRPARGAPAGPRDRAPERLRADRSRPVDRPAAARVRADRSLRDDLDAPRPPAPRDPALPSRPVGREDLRPRRDDMGVDDVRAARAARPVRPPAPRPVPESASTGRIRGLVAVIGVFLVTLAGAAVDWFLGDGLGVITLASLVATTAVAVLLVRRRDMVSVVLAPPLVFVGVAGLNIALSPSVDLSLPTAVTLMIRGFPTMAMATAAALVLCLVRLATRR